MQNFPFSAADFYKILIIPFYHHIVLLSLFGTFLVFFFFLLLSCPATAAAVCVFFFLEFGYESAMSIFKLKPVQLGTVFECPILSILFLHLRCHFSGYNPEHTVTEFLIRGFI